jgi:hypothetical protein
MNAMQQIFFESLMFNTTKKKKPGFHVTFEMYHQILQECDVDDQCRRWQTLHCNLQNAQSIDSRNAS